MATWRRAAAAALLALLVSACGSGSQADEATTTLRVLMADDWAGTPAVVAAVRDFEREHDGVRVQIQGQTFARIPDSVRAAIESGEPIDVAQWHAFAAAAQGLAEPLDEEWERLDPDAFLPGAIDDVRWEGRYYGVPLDVNAMVLMLNADRLAEVGLAVPSEPTSFGDIAAIARATTSADGSRRGLAIASSSWSSYGWIRANGGEVVDIGEDGKVRFLLDSPEVVEALAFLGGLVRSGVAFPPVAQQASTDAFALFQTQTAALHVSGSWETPSLEGEPWELAVRPLPRGMTGTTEGSALGGSSLFVPRDSANRRLAFAFMVHLTSDEYALRLAQEEGRLPARRAVFDAPFFDSPMLQTVIAQLETARPMRLIAFPDAARAFTGAIDAILTGRADAAAALADAQESAEQSLAGTSQ